MTIVGVSEVVKMKTDDWSTEEGEGAKLKELMTEGGDEVKTPTGGLAKSTHVHADSISILPVPFPFAAIIAGGCPAWSI